MACSAPWIPRRSSSGRTGPAAAGSRQTPIAFRQPRTETPARSAVSIIVDSTTAAANEHRTQPGTYPQSEHPAIAGCDESFDATQRRRLFQRHAGCPQVSLLAEPAPAANRGDRCSVLRGGFFPACAGAGQRLQFRSTPAGDRRNDGQGAGTQISQPQACRKPPDLVSCSGPEAEPAPGAENRRHVEPRAGRI